MGQIILHVDMDAFFASVEVRDDPSLKGKPLIIGSLPDERGVVSTCSYEARKYGVRSGMSIKEAYRLCPNGIYKHPDFEKYKRVSDQLHDIWYPYASSQEAIASDEAYLDISEQAKDFEGGRRIAFLIKERTLKETGLTCSVGLSFCKSAAKIASEENKPNGFCEIDDRDALKDLIRDKDVKVLSGVGEVTAEKLHKNGIYKVKDIWENEQKVISLFGKQGEWICRVSQGFDDRKVEPYRVEDAHSMGHEVTFQEDISSFELLEDMLRLLAIRVKHRCDRHQLYGYGVTLKITYYNMTSITRSRQTTLCESATMIFEVASQLLKEVKHKPVRLIGISLYDLSTDEGRQMSLFEMNPDKDPEEERKLLYPLNKRYGLDFSGHLEQLYESEVLYKSIEYMRKYYLAKIRL